MLGKAYSQWWATDPSQSTAKFWSLCKHYCFSSYSWGTYSNFCMISAELNRLFKTVEGGFELEASKYKCSMTSRERQGKIFLRFLLLRMGSSPHQQGWDLGVCEKCRLSSPISGLRNQKLHFNNIPGDSCVWKSLRSSSLEHGRPSSSECMRLQSRHNQAN